MNDGEILSDSFAEENAGTATPSRGRVNALPSDTWTEDRASGGMPLSYAVFAEYSSTARTAATSKVLVTVKVQLCRR